jgi:hypothetical protein
METRELSQMSADKGFLHTRLPTIYNQGANLTFPGLNWKCTQIIYTQRHALEYFVLLYKAT